MKPGSRKNNPLTFSVENLGCRVNLSEIEQITRDLTEAGFDRSRGTASDFVVINTCTVTSKADKKSLAMIKRYEKSDRIKKIFVTGCYSELEKDLVSKTNEKTTIIPQNKKNDMAELIQNFFYQPVDSNEHNVKKDFGDKWQLFHTSSNVSENMNNDQSRFFDHTRAFIKVQDGCNAFCSYCRIPMARGKPVSRPFDDVINQVKALVQEGNPEIDISGINLGSYRHESNLFSDLLSKILESSGHTLVRISSIEPFSLDDRLFDLLDHPSLCPHLHLPLQGGSNKILKKMNRRYTVEEFSKTVEKIYNKNPLFALSTDFIAGFPGETEQDFLSGMKLIEGLGFMKIHAFPYSPRPLTDAQKLSETVTPMEKKQRVKRLFELDERLQENNLKKLKGTPQRFIPEKLSADGDFWTGTTEYYIKGKLPAGQNIIKGRIEKVHITGTSPVSFSLIKNNN